MVFTEARAKERDDKIDALTKGFLGITVSCARCHDHKYDPISQKDYYALGGVFASSGYAEYPLVSEGDVKRYRAQQPRCGRRRRRSEQFVGQAQIEVATRLAGADGALSNRRAEGDAARSPGRNRRRRPSRPGLDPETFLRWGRYSRRRRRSSIHI